MVRRWRSTITPGCPFTLTVAKVAFEPEKATARVTATVCAPTSGPKRRAGNPSTRVELTDHVGVQDGHERVEVSGRTGGCEAVAHDSSSVRHRPVARLLPSRIVARARLASLRHAAGDRPTVRPTCSKVSPNTSWSTYAVRSGGERRSMTARSAMPTVSSSVTLSAGSSSSLGRSITGAGSHGPTYSGPDLVRAEAVEADAARDSDEPAEDVIDRLGVVSFQSRESGEGLLYGVLGVSEGAEHPVADVEHAASVGLPCRGHRFVRVRYGIHIEDRTGRAPTV